MPKINLAHEPRSLARWMLTLCVGSLLLTPEVGAVESAEARNRVSFQVRATRTVENDRVGAVLVASAEAAEAADCAAAVNEAMAWALDRSRGQTGVSVRSGGYNTHPVYDDGKIRRWRARQELILEGSDTEALAGVVGKLQSKLALESFQFSISDARRRETEDALIGEALGAFRERAELVRRSLDAQSWRLDEVFLDTEQGVVPHMKMQRMEAQLAGPAVESGTSQVTIQVRGTIALE